jgi:hypothetical protein
MLTCGDTFITGDDETEDWHLQIIVTPVSDTGEVVTVCVTTQRRTSETLVKLPTGCHPFINRPSVISYSYSKIRFLCDIDTAILNRTAKQRDAVSSDILKKAQDGLIDSDWTPNGVRHFFKQIMTP